MNAKLKILHLEDSSNDAELIARYLKKANVSCDIKAVADRQSYENALHEFKPDLILSDHTLPQFNSINALKIAKSVKPDLPFILITGTVSEEFAVDCIRGGANDYILKSNLTRLPNAIRTALKEREANNKLRSSEERYKQIVEKAHEGIWILNLNFETLFVNKKMSEILGYSFEEMMGKKLVSFLDEESKTIVVSAMPGYTTEYLELKCRTKAGRQIWIELSTSALSGGHDEFIGVLGMVTDITDRKIAHEKLVQSEKQIRNFAKHLNQTMEEESARIAREIHDELGQQLAGIKMALTALKRNDKEDFEKTIVGIMEDVDVTIQSVRKIATELRPGILDTLGLIPSLEWMVGEFQRKKGVRCVVKTPATQPKIDKNVSVCYFRICQESLTNITKHANADKVEVQLEIEGDEMTLTVSDNGKGIASEKLENPFSMGLLGMRERARIIGADLQITSEKGKGTKVQLKSRLS